MNLLYFTLNCIFFINIKADTKHTEYYDKLGVSPTADSRAIKKGTISCEKQESAFWNSYVFDKIIEIVRKRSKNFYCLCIQIKTEMIPKLMQSSWNLTRFTKC